MTKIRTRTRPRLDESNCRKFIGGQIGLLINTELADMETIRRAVVWWANTPEAWEALYALLDPRGEANAAAGDVVRGVVDKIRGRG